MKLKFFIFGIEIKKPALNYTDFPLFFEVKRRFFSYPPFYIFTVEPPVRPDFKSGYFSLAGVFVDGKRMDIQIPGYLFCGPNFPALFHDPSPLYIITLIKSILAKLYDVKAYQE